MIKLILAVLTLTLSTVVLAEDGNPPTPTRAAVFMPSIDASRYSLMDADSAGNATPSLPPLASLLSPAYLLGVGGTFAEDGTFLMVPSVQAGGTLALVNVANRALSLFLGGGFLAPGASSVLFSGTAGLAYSLTDSRKTEVAYTLFASYSERGWTFGFGLTVSNLL